MRFSLLCVLPHRLLQSLSLICFARTDYGSGRGGIGLPTLSTFTPNGMLARSVMIFGSQPRLIAMAILLRGLSLIIGAEDLFEGPY